MELAGRSLLQKVHYPANASTEEKVELLRIALQDLLEYWDIRRGVRAAQLSKRGHHSKLIDRATEATLRNMGYLSHVDAQSDLEKREKSARRAPRQEGSLLDKGCPSLDELHALLPPDEEPIDCVLAARRAWETSVNEELVAIAKEKAQPLLCMAVAKTLVDHEGKPKGAAQQDGAEYKRRKAVRFLYDSDDLLDVVENINPENVADVAQPMVPFPWALIRFQIRTPGIGELRRRFRELAPHFKQCGLDDLPDGAAGGTRPGLSLQSGAKHVAEVQDVVTFAMERQRDGRAAVASRFPPVARLFARRGVPTNLRPQLWRTALGLHDSLTEEELDYYAALRVRTEEEFCITDELFRVDAEFCGYDDRYFMFSDFLESVLLCFSRDILIHELEEVHPHAPLYGRTVSLPAPFDCVAPNKLRPLERSAVVLCKESVQLPVERAQIATKREATSKTPNASDPRVLEQLLEKERKVADHEVSLKKDESAMVVPPCGVQPFRGFVRYLAPLTYLYEDEEEAYFVLRAMWCRYWCKVNAIRSTSDTLVCLWRTFEMLLGEGHPALAMHLGAINAAPLRIVKHWIQHGFVGYLEVDQVLLLWDRIIGFDDLMILPVVAAAVLAFRAPILLRCGSQAEVREVMSDGSMLQIVPLIQGFLFPESVADLELAPGL